VELEAGAGDSPVAFVTPDDDMQQFRPPGMPQYSEKTVHDLEGAYEDARAGKMATVSVIEGQAMGTVIVVPKRADFSLDLLRYMSGLNFAENPFPEPLRHKVWADALRHEKGHRYLRQHHHHNSEYGPDMESFLQDKNPEIVRRWLALRACGVFFRARGIEGSYQDPRHHEWAGMVRPTDTKPELDRDKKFGAAEVDAVGKVALYLHQVGQLEELRPEDATAIDDAFKKQSGGTIDIVLPNMDKISINHNANGTVNISVSDLGAIQIKAEEAQDWVKAYVAFNRERQKAATSKLKLVPDSIIPEYTAYLIEPNGDFAKKVIHAITELNKAGKFNEAPAEQVLANNLLGG
jgi:hypothetical protein